MTDLDKLIASHRHPQGIPINTRGKPMTPKQRKLARHALRLANPVKRNFCNHYNAIYAGANYDEWVRMVDDGMAKTDGRKIKTGPEVEIVVFTLTHAGAMAALEPGESLYPEDFSE